MLTYHCQFLLHGLSDHVGRGDVFNPQRRINGFMFFSLSVLNLEDHLGLVISPQSPLSAGYITLRACRRSLPLRFSTVTPGGIVGFLIVSYRFNIPDRLAVHLSIHARPELRAHCRYNQLPMRTPRVFVPTFHIGAAKHASFHAKKDAGHLVLAVLLASRNHLRILWF